MENNSDSGNVKEQPVSIGPIKINCPLGIGCWSWGDTSKWGYQPSDDENIYSAFSKVIDSGIDLFDTAELYGKGKSEELLGKFIKRKQDEQKDKSSEHKLITASKFIPLPWRVTHAQFRWALDASLKRLGLPFIDIDQVHGPALSTRAVEVWAEAMVGAVQAGLIKAVGVSNYSANQVRRTHQVLKEHGIPLASNQVEFSLLRNNAEVNGLLKTCQELDVAVIAYSPLGMGRLTGKYDKNNPPPSDRQFGKVDLDTLDKIVQTLKTIGEVHGKTPSQVALNWCICKGTIPICGVKNEKQATDNIGAIGWRLNDDEMKQLNALAQTGSSNFWQEN